jgi:hypothetical protein
MTMSCHPHYESGSSLFCRLTGGNSYSDRIGQCISLGLGEQLASILLTFRLRVRKDCLRSYLTT